jgi:iron complex outermembrane recepter protein
MHKAKSLFASVAVMALLAAASPACAQTAPAGASTPAGVGAHDADLIVITALIPRSHVDILGGTSVLTGDTLARSLRPNLGETLTRQPGVSATSFGPNASRPILRGFAGDRIRLLTDGIGSFDVSATSVDHAVAINPLLADRIEVLHGPAALLYGSSAVGGVVNVLDSRIPTRQPSGGASLDAMATYGSAAEERTIAGKAEASLGGGLVFHVDGSFSKSADLRIGGAVLTPALQAQARASGDEEAEEAADLVGRLPNSAAETWAAGGGLTWFSGGGHLGFALSRMESTYGVPVRYSVEAEDHPAEEQAEDAHGHAHGVQIAMKQTRVDLRAYLPVNGDLLDHVRLRAGWADYEHSEIEDGGVIGTRFFVQGMEARLELVQTRQGGWDGAIGAQALWKQNSILGEEKFLPANETESWGLFTLQSLDLGTVRLEAGGRIERTHVSARADADLGNGEINRHFTTYSGSIGGSLAIAPGVRFGVNLSRSERAPTADELFARGNHAGTQAFELGDPNFGTERGWGVEAKLHGEGEGFHVGLTGFYNRFSGFISDQVVDDAACLAVTGGDTLEFPCYQFSQGDARYMGFEAEGELTLGQIGQGELKADALVDAVRATLIGNGPAPRIPPLRIRGGLSWESDAIMTRIEVEHATRQDRVSALETATPAYTLVGASIGWRPFGDNRIALSLDASNLFDVNARRHASILKDYAPLAGRDIRATARLSF